MLLLHMRSYRKDLIATIFAFITGLSCQAIAAESKIYGPENMLTTTPTPFTKSNAGNDGGSSSDESGDFAPIAISTGLVSRQNLLSERFHGPKLFLPPRMVLGECSEFIVQGPPGSYVAIAMADKNSGAKPVCGHEIKLGPDRKLVGINKISEQGTASISVEAPIEGDLVGSSLYFEAVVWSKPDFSDMQLATTVSPQKATSGENGVTVCEQPDGKKEGLIKVGTSEPMSMKTVGGLSSGRP